jgi:hypothetical protein
MRIWGICDLLAQFHVLSVAFGTNDESACLVTVLMAEMASLRSPRGNPMSSCALVVKRR